MKFNMLTRHAADSQNCSTNLQAKPDIDNVGGDKTNTSDCLNSNTNKIYVSDYFYSSKTKEADPCMLKQSKSGNLLQTSYGSLHTEATSSGL